MPRKYDHDLILNLCAQGKRPSEVARRLGMPLEAVRYIRFAAIRRGDVRATPKAAPAARSSASSGQEEPPRPGVMVITVPSAKLDGEGAPKRIRISLPRLSILEGWTGAAS